MQMSQVFCAVQDAMIQKMKCCFVRLKAIRALISQETIITAESLIIKQ